MAKRKRKRRSSVKTVAATCKQGKGGRLYDCKAWKKTGYKKTGKPRRDGKAGMTDAAFHRKWGQRPGRVASGGRRGKRFHPEFQGQSKSGNFRAHYPVGYRGGFSPDVVPSPTSYGARFGGLGAYPHSAPRTRRSALRPVLRYQSQYGPRRPLRRVLGVRLPRRSR